MFKKMFSMVGAGLVLSGVQAADVVQDLLKFAPEAAEYVVLFDADCLSGTDNSGKKYEVNNLEKYGATPIEKVGYYLRLEANDGKVLQVFATVDPFMEKNADYSFPRFWPKFDPIQKNVNNLTVKSDVPGVENGTFPGGNVEIWLGGYTAKNSAGVPGASDEKCDFGDQPTPGNYGSFQLHNTGKKQTVFAVNGWYFKEKVDLGIGNAPTGEPDWSHSYTGKNMKSARMLILLKVK